MELSFDIVALLFIVACFAGFIDAAAGGGGLITIPALLFTGIPPVQALGTNKFQACFGSFSASLHFIRQGLVSPRRMLLMISTVAITAALGAYTVQLLDPQLLLNFLPAVFIAIAIYSLVTKQLGGKSTKPRINHAQFAITAAPCVGFYDGFAGPGTGTFFALAFVKLLGMDFVTATAHAKILNFTSNLSSLIVFAWSGQILVAAGLCMAAGQFLGAKLGARAVIHKGAGFIRLLTVVMSVAISLSLLLKS